MISVEQLTVRFGGKPLFENISLLVNPKERVALVGKNGAGKSTLLKILAGQQEPSEGRIVVPGDATVGYLPQQMIHKDGKTVYAETQEAFIEVNKLQERINYINKQLEERTDYESDGYTRLIEDLTEATEKFDMLGGASVDADIEQTLAGLGFLPHEFHRQTNTFSGGWRMRIELAKLLLRKPDVLLLDEPTNHLDIESIQWLEQFLKNHPGAVILVSHDRAFLDNVTNRTVEIVLGSLHDYNVPYTKYTILRKERREQQMAAYNNQQKMIEDTEKFIERFRYKATKAVQVQSRIKQLDKIDRIEIEDEDNSAISLRFPPAPRSGSIVVEAENLTKKYGPKTILNHVGITVERGEKVAFVGKNGEGKTTLSKIIMHQVDYEGKLKIGHNVNIGYFAQNQDELMDGEKTVLQTIDDIAVGDIRTKIRDILGAFLFGGEDVEKKVKVLSGGERSRLAIAKLLLEPYNVLVLDEPTNHLDMRSKDILKQALVRFDGTLIVVSHDREFLDGLVEVIYEFKNHKIRQHFGGIYDFLKKRNIENFRELEKKTPAANVEKQSKEEKSDNKQNYIEKKEFDKKVRKVSNQIATAEKNIEKYEKRIAELDTLMANPEVLAEKEDQGRPVYDEYKQLKINLTKEMERWESLQLELEEIKA